MQTEVEKPLLLRLRMQDFDPFPEAWCEGERQEDMGCGTREWAGPKPPDLTPC